MKVLVISHSCAADVNQQQFVALNQLADVEVCLIMPASWRNDYTGAIQESNLLPAVDFPVHRLPIAFSGQVSLHFYTKLALRQLRQFRPDVILSTQEPWSLSGLQAVLLSRLLRVPLVFQTNQNIFKRYPFPFSWIERTSYQNAGMALAYSEEARQVMIQKGLDRPSKVVPYGTDLTLFHPQSSSSSRHKLQLEGKTVFGYMGRLVKEKGLDTLVAAVKILLDQQPDSQIAVLLVGTGEYENALRQQIREAGLESIFVFAGAVPHNQAAEHMRCIDVFVLPSRTMPNWKEQFGRVIIEAMACGVPVVGSNSGQIPVLVQDTGGGLIFTEGKAEELAEQLAPLLNNPERRRKLGEVGRISVHRAYTFEAVAQQLHDVLQDTVSSISKNAPVGA